MLSKEFCDEMRLAGLDTAEMIGRFMDSENMFVRYLGLFFESADTVMPKLAAAKENKDYAEMLPAAHALKGLAGNIGLNGVYVPAKKIVDDIRADYFDDCGGDCESLMKAYDCAKNAAAKEGLLSSKAIQ